MESKNPGRGVIEKGFGHNRHDGCGFKGQSGRRGGKGYMLQDQGKGIGNYP